MKTLEVGDEVVYINCRVRTYYKIEKVVRVTPKRAYTDGGNELVREATQSGRYKKKGSYETWKLLTPEIREQVRIEAELSKAETWFKTSKLSREEMKRLYDLFYNDKKDEHTIS